MFQQWCSNPESQSTHMQILFDSVKCIGCGQCQSQCPHSLAPGEQETNPACEHCGRCVQVCPANALEQMGKCLEMDQILDEVARDEEYYHSTGGGVTISGGEPLLYPDYVCQLARRLKEMGYHLAIETTGYAPWEQADQVFQQMDLILFDMKAMDDRIHRQYTGRSNRIILENARQAAQLGYPLVFRVPLMGGINDTEENITQLAAFCQETGVKQVEFLPYHRLGENKYRMMGRDYHCKAYAPSLEHRRLLARILEEKGVEVKIGK